MPCRVGTAQQRRYTPPLFRKGGGGTNTKTYFSIRNCKNPLGYAPVSTSNVTVTTPVSAFCENDGTSSVGVVLSKSVIF